MTEAKFGNALDTASNRGGKPPISFTKLPQAPHLWFCTHAHCTVHVCICTYCVHVFTSKI